MITFLLPWCIYSQGENDHKHWCAAAGQASHDKGARKAGGVFLVAVRVTRNTNSHNFGQKRYVHSESRSYVHCPHLLSGTERVRGKVRKRHAKVQDDSYQRLLSVSDIRWSHTLHLVQTEGKFTDPGLPSKNCCVLNLNSLFFSAVHIRIYSC